MVSNIMKRYKKFLNISRFDSYTNLGLKDNELIFKHLVRFERTNMNSDKFFKKKFINLQ
jgi:hypothetical protein